MDESGWVSIAVIVVSTGTGWLLNVHARLSRHEASCEQRQRNLDERHAAISRMLEVINAKMDALMSSGHGGAR